MALPIKTGFPDALVLSENYTVILRAVDPTTGADVAGVVISEAVIQGDNLLDTGEGQPPVTIPKIDPNYFANEEMV